MRPKCFVMENVVGLLTNQRGRALKGVLSVFENIGYSISWRVLNAAFYGLPQRRERFILVGTKEGVAFEWPAPMRYLNGAKSMAGRFGQKCEASPLFCDDLKPANTVMDAIHDLPALASGESATHYRDDVEPTVYELQMRGACKFLTLHEATRHSPKMLEIIKHSGHNISSLPKGLVSSGFSSCYSRLEPDLPSVTLTVNFVHPASNKCIHPTQARALTPRRGAFARIPGRIRVRGHTGADREANRQRRPPAVWSGYRELTREAHRVGRRPRRLLAPSWPDS